MEYLNETTDGLHWSQDRFFTRRIRLEKDHPLVEFFKDCPNVEIVSPD